MDKNQILAAIQMLSRSQGFYCRVLEEVNNNPQILDYLAEQNFTDVVDMVMFLEC